MNSFQRIRPLLAGSIKIWIPLALWLALWLSISPGNLQNISHPERFIDFLNGLRALFPFVAGGIAGLILLYVAYNRRFDVSLFKGPLGLVFLYAAIGLIAILRSSDMSQSAYWVGSYISVPLVLWAIASGPDRLGMARRIVDLTWLLMTVAGVVLIAYAFLRLDLLNAILHPEILENCRFGTAWFFDTSGVLRSTGVGRYGAVACLIAIAGIAHGRWRIFWQLLFVAALLLLLSSGARTAFVAFVGASTLMVLLYGGRRSIVIGSVATIIILPVFLITGAHKTVVSECLLRRAPPVYLIQNDVPIIRASGTNESFFNLGPDVVKTKSGVGGTAVLPNPSGTIRPDQGATSSSNSEPTAIQPNIIVIEAPFVSFSGRSEVWREGLKLIKKSPLLGYGFNSDRILLGAHMHQAFLHSLVQTGALGTIPLIAGILLAWWFLFKAIRHLKDFTKEHRSRIVLASGILAFFTIRSLAESSGAFFGIDWLILAPVLLYLPVVDRSNEAKIVEEPLS